MIADIPASDAAELAEAIWLLDLEARGQLNGDAIRRMIALSPTERLRKADRWRTLLRQYSSGIERTSDWLKGD
jgi:hypothetical protein